MKCGSTVTRYKKVRFSSCVAVSKAWVHVSCLMTIKIMILFIWCNFSSCIILHATKVACEHRYRGGGCWQLFSINCHFSSTRSCNTHFLGGPWCWMNGYSFSLLCPLYCLFMGHPACFCVCCQLPHCSVLRHSCLQFWLQGGGALYPFVTCTSGKNVDL